MLFALIPSEKRLSKILHEVIPPRTPAMDIVLYVPIQTALHWPGRLTLGYHRWLAGCVQSVGAVEAVVLELHC